MRIFGWIALIAGISSVLLFALAMLGGARLPVAAFLASAIQIALGSRFIALGAPKPKAVPGCRTLELALTPATRALIESEVAKSRRLYAIVAAAGLLFFPGLALLLQAASEFMPAFTIAMAAVGAALALILGLVWTLQRGWPAAAICGRRPACGPAGPSKSSRFPAGMFSGSPTGPSSCFRRPPR